MNDWENRLKEIAKEINEKYLKDFNNKDRQQIIEYLKEC